MLNIYSSLNVTYGHRDNIILQRTKPSFQLYCSDEITYTSYMQSTQQKDLGVFSNNSPVSFCISYCRQPVSMFAQMMFDIAIYCSSMSNITIHKLCCCFFVCEYAFEYIYSSKLLIVLFGVKLLVSAVVKCHRWTHGVIFQRTKPCAQFYCSGKNTSRQYYQQKALEVPSNDSKLHYCCKPCVWYDDGPGLMG